MNQSNRGKKDRFCSISKKYLTYAEKNCSSGQEKNLTDENLQIFWDH